VTAVDGVAAAAYAASLRRPRQKFWHRHSRHLSTDRRRRRSSWHRCRVAQLLAVLPSRAFASGGGSCGGGPSAGAGAAGIMRIDMTNVFARRMDPGLPWRLSQPAPAVIRRPRGGVGAASAA
jgi:hypothetical protein